VALRFIESDENTTHCTRGHEFVQAILDAWVYEHITDASYKRMLLMSVRIYKGYQSNEPPIVGLDLDTLFKDDDALTKVVAEMLEDQQ
jgi:hypothetical protein